MVAAFNAVVARRAIIVLCLDLISVKKPSTWLLFPILGWHFASDTGVAMTWTQVYDPLGHWWLSTLVAALPIVVLKVQAHLCAVAGAATALLCAIFVFGMPTRLALASFVYGTGFGLLKIVWIVVAAVFLYDISVATGQFEIMKQSVAAITPDRRLQLLLVAFCFGSFIEGAAGFGAPVAIAVAADPRPAMMGKSCTATWPRRRPPYSR